LMTSSAMGVVAALSKYTRCIKCVVVVRLYSSAMSCMIFLARLFATTTELLSE
jgi:hypothetical protein